MTATEWIQFAGIICGRGLVQHRPLLSQFNGSAAVVLYVVALPFALERESLSADWLAPYWTIGAAFIWYIGRKTERSLYRYEAYALALLALGAAVTNNFEGRMSDHAPALWLGAVITLLLFEAFAEILKTEGESSGLNEYDRFSE